MTRMFDKRVRVIVMSYGASLMLQNASQGRGGRCVERSVDGQQVLPIEFNVSDELPIRYDIAISANVLRRHR